MLGLGSRLIEGSSVLPVKLIRGSRQKIDLRTFSEELGRLKGTVLATAMEQQYNTEFTMEVRVLYPDTKEERPEVKISWKRPENKYEYEKRTQTKRSNAHIAQEHADNARELAELKRLVKLHPIAAKDMIKGLK